MKSGVKRTLIITAAVASVAAGVIAFRARSGDGNAVVRYETQPAVRGDVRSFVTATGVLQPWKIVDVKPDVGGRINKLAVDLGDHVKAGQLIALIDPTDTQSAAQQANADLGAAVAKRDQAIASEGWQQATAGAHVAAAEQSLQTALAKEAQAKVAMQAQPGLTNSAINQAQAELASAKRQVELASQNKSQLQQELEQLKDVTLPMNSETARNDLSQSQANMQTMTAEYNRNRELLAQGYIAKADVETAYAKLATAQSAQRSAEQRQKTVERDNTLQIQQMNSRIAQAQSQIETEQQKVKQSEAALKSAQQNGVQDQLKQRDYQAAQSAAKQARAELEAARAELRQIVVKQKDVVAAQSEIVKNQAAAKQAATNLNYTRVLAPRDGIVVTKSVEEGTVVPSSRQAFGSTSAMVQIGDVSHLWVVCKVDETDIRHIHEGQSVLVHMDAYPGEEFAAKVIRVDPQAIIDQNVTMIPVTVELTAADARFKPGMNASCQFVTGEAHAVLTVPSQAVRPGKKDGYSVQTLVNGKPQRVRVEVGILGKDTTEIRSGLEEGQQVVTHVIQPQQPKSAATNNPFAPAGGGRGGAGGGGGGRRAR